MNEAFTKNTNNFKALYVFNNLYEIALKMP